MADPEKKKPEKTKDEKNTRRPSALKRDLQSEKRRLVNRSFRASVLTAVRLLETALSKKESEADTKIKIQQIYSLMDKGVKKGVFKSNKAARTKSRLSSRLTKVSV